MPAVHLSLPAPEESPPPPSCSFLSFASPVHPLPFLFALSLFLPSWCLFVPSPSPSLPRHNFLVRPPEFAYRIVLCLDPLHKSREKKKKGQKRRHSFGREGSQHHKTCFNPCILFAHISYRFVASPASLAHIAFRLRRRPQHLLISSRPRETHPSPASLFGRTRGSTTSTHDDPRPQGWITFWCLPPLRSARLPPIGLFERSTRLRQQSTARPRRTPPVTPDAALHLPLQPSSPRRQEAAFFHHLLAEAACFFVTKQSPRLGVVPPVSLSAIAFSDLDAHSAPTLSILSHFAGC